MSSAPVRATLSIWPASVRSPSPQASRRPAPNAPPPCAPAPQPHRSETARSSDRLSTTPETDPRHRDILRAPAPVSPRQDFFARAHDVPGLQPFDIGISRNLAKQPLLHRQRLLLQSSDSACRRSLVDSNSPTRSYATARTRLVSRSDGSAAATDSSIAAACGIPPARPSNLPGRTASSHNPNAPPPDSAGW